MQLPPCLLTLCIEFAVSSSTGVAATEQVCHHWKAQVAPGTSARERIFRRLCVGRWSAKGKLDGQTWESWVRMKLNWHIARPRKIERLCTFREWKISSKMSQVSYLPAM